jgi:hypothetical protein
MMRPTSASPRALAANASSSTTTAGRAVAMYSTASRTSWSVKVRTTSSVASWLRRPASASVDAINTIAGTTR